MTNYQNKVQEIIQSMVNFSFDFDADEIHKEMELVEVPDEQLKKLNQEQLNEKFLNGTYKIKLADGKIYDINIVIQHCIKHNIQEPVIVFNPDCKYLMWIIKKDLAYPQLKKHIKKQLSGNDKINLSEVEKAMIVEAVKSKEPVGYLDNLKVKTSKLISEKRLIINADAKSEDITELISRVLNELKQELPIYVKMRLNRDYRYIFIYTVFITILIGLWIIIKESKDLEIWVSTLIGVVLFVVPLVIMRLINHSFFDAVFAKTKAEKKYENEFYSN